MAALRPMTFLAVQVVTADLVVVEMERAPINPVVQVQPTRAVVAVVAEPLTVLLHHLQALAVEQAAILKQ
jgi:hypothetical protein